jgi:hypothetical protein
MQWSLDRARPDRKWLANAGAVDPRATTEVQLDYSQMANRDHDDVALVCGGADNTAIG